MAASVSLKASGSFDDVLVALKNVIADVLKVPADAIGSDAKLTDLPRVESIKLLRIAGKIERKFKIELDDEAMFRHATLEDVAAAIAARVGDRR